MATAASTRRLVSFTLNSLYAPIPRVRPRPKKPKSVKPDLLSFRYGSPMPRNAGDNQRVSDVVRAPSFCAGPRTTLATVIDQSPVRAPWDAIPVLAEDARPLGLVTADALQSSHARGVSLEAPLTGLMETQLVHVQPSTSLFDAASVLFRAGTSHLIVSARDGTFLGLVAEIDLVRDMPAFRASLR